MLSLTVLRRQLLSTVHLRAALLLLLLALVATGMPRWELHAHEHAHDESQVTLAHDHAHESLSLQHLGPHPLNSDSADEMPIHVHEASSVSASIGPVSALIVQALPRAPWRVPAVGDQLLRTSIPPPHRPPIV